MLSVPKIFCHCKSGKTHSHSRPRRLVHLSVHERGFRKNSRLFHLVIQVVSLSCALSYAGEHGYSAVLLRDVIYKLLYQYGFADSCAPEQTYLSALRIRADQVYNLDARLKHFGFSLLILKTRCGAMYIPTLLNVRCGHAVYRLAEQVKHPAQGVPSHRHCYRSHGVYCRYPPRESVGRAHSYASYDVVTYMLCDLQNYMSAVIVNGDGVIQLRKFSLLKAYIKNRSDYLGDGSCVFSLYIVHGVHNTFPSGLFYHSDCAPDTISVIWRVIEPFLALL